MLEYRIYVCIRCQRIRIYNMCSGAEKTLDHAHQVILIYTPTAGIQVQEACSITSPKRCPVSSSARLPGSSHV